jgi:hypothetical protein
MLSFLLRPALALVAWSILHKEGMLVPLVSGLVPSFGRSTPWTDRMNITLGFTTTTTVRMIGCNMSTYDKQIVGRLQY